MIGSAIRKRVAGKQHALDHDWRRLVDKELDPMPTEAVARDEEERARTEKVASLKQLARFRFSVLVGPAGSGKTTLLKILSNLPQVNERKVLLLAPTGKARVRLEEATERIGEGKTLAQFLQGLESLRRSQRGATTGIPPPRARRRTGRSSSMNVRC